MKFLIILYSLLALIIFYFFSLNPILHQHTKIRLPLLHSHPYELAEAFSLSPYTYCNHIPYTYMTFHVFVKPSYLPEVIRSIYYKIVHVIYVFLLPGEIKIPLHNNTVSVITHVNSIIRKCIQDPFFYVFEFYYYSILNHFYYLLIALISSINSVFIQRTVCFLIC